MGQHFAFSETKKYTSSKKKYTTAGSGSLTNMSYGNDLVWHNIFSVDRIRKKKIVSIFE